ncbi:zeta toxin family protein [Streptomyces sp. NPDC047061]|uniref:zeta toxin family protein n=1 Tax=Streptomyces sp. NPDC047061 TaxID=3154605 RepID=UPI003404786C
METGRGDGTDTRLSAKELQSAFRDIRHDHLSGLPRSSDPRAVLVVGQPGSGKTESGHRWRPLIPGRSPVRISGDRFKSYHPHHQRLLIRDPRTAGKLIRPDYQLWQEMAEEYVRTIPADVVVEIAPGSPKGLLASAAAYRERGYHLTLVALAVRRADSRQGILHRYAVGSQGGELPCRLTPADGHDACYTSLPGALSAVERSAAVDVLTVVRRDQTELYRAERHPDGRLGSGAVSALEAERLRPYSPPEAVEFCRVQQELDRDLPEERPELDEIAALAWPLLPSDMRPQSGVRKPR